MFYLIFSLYLWFMGVINFERDLEMEVESIIARGQCRQISVDKNNCVTVKFLNREDAEIFAKDLKHLIEESQNED